MLINFRQFDKLGPQMVNFKLYFTENFQRDCFDLLIIYVGTSVVAETANFAMFA